MNEAIDEIKRICRDKKIIGLYNAEKVAKKEMNNRLDYAKQQGYDSGEAAGMEKEKLAIARNLLNEDIDVTFIAKVTGLTKEQIEELK